MIVITPTSVMPSVHSADALLRTGVQCFSIAKLALHSMFSLIKLLAVVKA